MKPVLKVVAILVLAACFVYLFIGQVPSFGDAAAQVVNTEWALFPDQEGYARSLLSSEQQVLYDAFVDGINNSLESTSVANRDYTGEDVNAAVLAAKMDRPEFFWVEFEGTQYVIDSDGVELNFSYLYTGDELTQMKTALDTKVNEALALMGSQQLVTDYEKASYLHDYVIKICSYDVSQVRPNTHNIYGALVEGVAVCDGYARAYQYLMAMAGIECYLVEGTASQIDYTTGAIKTEGHAWNKANLDGVVTNIDLTWDDPDYELKNTDLAMNIVLHTYFGLSDAEIGKSHVADTAFAAPAGESAWWLQDRGLVGAYPGDVSETAATALVRNLSGSSSYVEIAITDATSYDEFPRSYDAGVDGIIDAANASRAANGASEFQLGATFLPVSGELGTIVVICTLEGYESGDSQETTEE